MSTLPSFSGKKILLSTAYLPPLRYMSKLLLTGEVWLEGDENYTKQTFRNRCLIAGPNGPQALSIPVEKGSFHKVHIRDVRIDRSSPWEKLHLRALNAAYRSSPFYEYYIDDLMEVLERRPVFLFDLNLMLLERLLELTGISCTLHVTRKFTPPDTEGVLDLRERILPKRQEEDPFFRHPVYHQVFEEKSGFLPGMSIVDLLFNEGPDTGKILKESILFPSKNGT